MKIIVTRGRHWETALCPSSCKQLGSGGSCTWSHQRCSHLKHLTGWGRPSSCPYKQTGDHPCVSPLRHGKEVKWSKPSDWKSTKKARSRVEAKWDWMCYVPTGGGQEESQYQHIPFWALTQSTLQWWRGNESLTIHFFLLTWPCFKNVMLILILGHLEKDNTE